MKNFITIMKKELARVFKSPTSIIGLLVPGILLFAMYSLMGQVAPVTSEEQALTENYIIYAVNMPSEFEGILLHEDSPFDVELRSVTAAEAEKRLDYLNSHDIHLVVVFAPNFHYELINERQPSLEVFFNPFNIVSDFANRLVFMPSFNAYVYGAVAYISGTNPVNVFPDISVTAEFDEHREGGGILANMIPMVLIMLMFTAAMSYAVESIAGEKERGTMATLLATPARRSAIALGKVASLSVLAMISTIGSFIGLMAGLAMMLEVSLFAMYGFGELTLLFFIMIAAVLVIVGLITVLSALSKTIKDAQMLVSVFMMASMGIGLLKMVTGIPAAFFFYLIPIFNVTAGIASVIAFEVVILNLVMTLISSLAYAGILIFVLTKLFGSEKIMFSK